MSAGDGPDEATDALAGLAGKVDLEVFAVVDVMGPISLSENKKAALERGAGMTNLCCPSSQPR
jgi:hypothetical protein